jgi:hypothetical protein
MSDALPLCLNFSSDLAYETGALLVCPLCATVITDAFGTPLADVLDSCTALSGMPPHGTGC